jgi:hypothetical protein
MRKTPIFYKISGITLVATLVLTACNLVASTATPVSATATQAAAASPIPPTATQPPAVTATPAPTATTAPTATLAPTATTQQTAQVIPSVNAFCRKGPGTDYYEITYLTLGTPYNVLGRNSLNTWWLVQASANVTCWEGDSGSTLLGPVDQSPVALVPILPVTPATFVETNTCNTSAHTLDVTFNWSAVSNVTGYRIFRNSTQITDAGSTATSFSDPNAPTGTNLVYGLEAHNDYGVAPLITVSVPTCG